MVKTYGRAVLTMKAETKNRRGMDGSLTHHRGLLSGFAGFGMIKQYDRKHDRERDPGKDVEGDITHNY
ncbi:MAG: hypothetical protein HYT41_02830 [Candidatus Sungbacteria bacterium]|nr:hypothetical protein [Candidatus Sungbacteria bacterium]